MTYRKPIHRIEPTWVVIKLKIDCSTGKTGNIKAWRDYGDVAWGSPLYEVLGYYKGSHKNAIKNASELTA